MSENKQRQHNARTQQRNWEDTSNQRSHEDNRNTNYDQNREEHSQPRLTQSEPYPDYTNNQYSQRYQNDLSQNYSDWNTQNAQYNDYGWQGQSQRDNRNYDRGQNLYGNQNQYSNQGRHNNFGQEQYSQGFTPDEYNNPYMRDNRQNWPQSLYNGQRYGGHQQYGGQFGSQQYGNSMNSPRWNEGNYRDNTGYNSGQSGQHNNFGRTNQGMSPNWETNRQSSYRIDEQGSLFSSGPYKGKGPKGYQRSDERIKEDISDRLMEDGMLDATDIEVEVDNNEVVLSGHVESRESKRRAEELAESIAGVNNVENRLHIIKDSWNEKKHSSNLGSESKNKRNSLAGSAS